MGHGRGVLAVIVVCACGGRTEVASKTPEPAPANTRTAILQSYSCFRIEVPATQTAQASVRGMCARTVADCEIGLRTVQQSLVAEFGPNAPTATGCEPADRAYCAFAAPTEKPPFNACGPDAPTCSWLKANLARAGSALAGECLEFPSSRLNLPAVEPIQFRMWCFRDAGTVAGSDCQSTQRACEAKVDGLVRQGIVKASPWRDGALCAAHDKVTCYPQLHRSQEQVKFICTPSFEECHSRASQSGGPDFQVLGDCAVVTGNKPW